MLYISISIHSKYIVMSLEFMYILYNYSNTVMNSSYLKIVFTIFLRKSVGLQRVLQ